ncbi:hypothetical protein QBC35DRAFT_153489 [Podospora australis]|uniref:Uncharacterized protein n=1 Tax=Podospora australis TaxID=1536484 RepID=A0AAN6WX86_9PEZI|nr:hypothetical protein QBC35DRAFT_153489 [Podospora australis]
MYSNIFHVSYSGIVRTRVSRKRSRPSLVYHLFPCVCSGRDGSDNLEDITETIKERSSRFSGTFSESFLGRLGGFPFLCLVLLGREERERRSAIDFSLGVGLASNQGFRRSALCRYRHTGSRPVYRQTHHSHTQTRSWCFVSHDTENRALPSSDTQLSFLAHSTAHGGVLCPKWVAVVSPSRSLGSRRIEGLFRSPLTTERSMTRCGEDAIGRDSVCP